ncbi:MAG: transcriptional regulator of aromatic amino acid metabolism [Glaciecola sp.]|jgi:transcriptional regulator of aromatic amino acid metabolism
MKQHWLESGGLSGYRNVRQELLEVGINCTHLPKVSGEVQLFGETKHFQVADEVEMPVLFSIADKGTVLSNELVSLPLA